jgi:alpha-ketoglutarate-dependent taurine dioxygenase
MDQQFEPMPTLLASRSAAHVLGRELTKKLTNDSAAVSKMDRVVIADHAPKNIPEAMTVLPCQGAVGTHAFSACLEEACFLVRLDSWGDLSTHARKGAVDAFNSYGFCVLECNQPWDDTLDIHALFGNSVEHPLADSMGCVYIDPSLEECSKNVKDTDAEHQPHTDESYSDNPGAIIFMRCEIAARSGGDSIIISGQAMYDAAAASLTSAQLEALFEPCLTVGRALPGKEHTLATAFFSIFSRLPNGHVGVRWRSRDAYLLSVVDAAKPGYDFLTKYVEDSQNRLLYRLQPGQVIIMDNKAVLHGRTPYDPQDRRRYIRTNFYNNGALRSELVNGFNPYPLPEEALWSSREGSEDACETGTASSSSLF